MRNQDATLVEHRIGQVTYRLERIECTCGDVVTAPPDTYKRDQHGPLVRAWAEHRARAGLTTKRPETLEAYR